MSALAACHAQRAQQPIVSRAPTLWPRIGQPHVAHDGASRWPRNRSRRCGPFAQVGTEFERRLADGGGESVPPIQD